MDKKKLKNLEEDDIKGFEEFIEGQPSESTFLPRGVGGNKKNEVGFEHFTFLSNDAERLTRLKNLLGQKLPFPHALTRVESSSRIRKKSPEK